MQTGSQLKLANLINKMKSNIPLISMMYWIHRTSTQTISTVYLGLQLPPFSLMEEPENANNNAMFRKGAFRIYGRKTWNLHQ